MIRFADPSRTQPSRNIASTSEGADHALLVGALLVGLALRFWGLRFGLPHPVARVDEEVLVDAALSVLRDGNPRFFDWPSLFINVTAACYAVVFGWERAIGGAIRHAAIAKAAFQPFLHLVPRTLSAAAGVATILIVYRATRELITRRTAAIAAAFLAVAFLHVRDSHFGVTDVPATFIGMLAFWAAVRCATRGASLRRVAIAGLLGGLATATKYNMALMLLPAGIAIVWPQVRETQRRGDSVRGLAVLAACAAVAFFVATPFALLDSREFLTSVATVRSHLHGGHVLMTRGWPYHARFTLRYGVGIPLMAASVAGAVWLAIERPRAALLILAFQVPYYVYLGSGITVFVRYLVPLVPLLCVTGAFLAERVGQSVADRWRGRAPHRVAIAGVTSAIVAVLVAAPTLRSSLLFDRLMSREDTRVTGANWVASHFPMGASMYQSGFGAAHLQPAPRTLYQQYAFDESANRFTVDHTPVDAEPDVIVLLEAPLGPYTLVPSEITALVSRDYVAAATIASVPAAAASEVVYDGEDAFFTPYGGIEAALQPGPTIRIYERRR